MSNLSSLLATNLAHHNQSDNQRAKVRVATTPTNKILTNSLASSIIFNAVITVKVIIIYFVTQPKRRAELASAILSVFSIKAEVFVANRNPSSMTKRAMASLGKKARTESKNNDTSLSHSSLVADLIKTV